MQELKESESTDMSSNARFGRSPSKTVLVFLSSLIAILLTFIGYSPHNISVEARPSTIPASARTEYLIEGMSLEEMVGQLFIVDLRRVGDTPVRHITREVAMMFERYQPGGVLLFGENIDTVEQIRALTSNLKKLSRHPLTIAVDYEGGVVSRLTTSGKIPATRIPPSRDIGATGDARIAYDIGVIMGRELGVLGITMNFAPVADVFTHPESMIGNRSFSESPADVGKMVYAMVAGLQDTGINSVVKHYPGHGNVPGDTHDGLVTLNRSLEELRKVELVPFEAAIAAGVDGIMTAHIVVPKVSGRDTPTTFSYDMITELLRTELGHDGLIITDSLIMRAVRARWNSDESAVSAILAGADIILQPLNVESAFAGILEAVRGGRISKDRIIDSARRVIFAKLNRDSEYLFDLDPYDVLGATEHVAVIQKIDVQDD